MAYLKILIAQIKDRSKWPDFDRPAYLGELNTIADDAYDSNTVHGHLAAILIYHQLMEEMLRLLLQYSEFFVQLELAPIEIHFPIPEKAMFGRILEAAKSSMDFENKSRLLSLADSINKERIKLVHGLTKQQGAEAIGKKTKQMKEQFDEYCNIFTETQDWFLLCFKDLRKDHDWEEMLADE